MDHHKAIAEEISHTIAKKIAIGIAIFIAFVLFVVFGGFAVQLLWNWLLPDIFQVRRITVWEALGLLALCRILFGGFGRGGGPRKHLRRRRRHRAWWKPSEPPATGDTAAPAAPR